MPTTTRPLASLWTAVRTQIRDSRDERAARTALERELASYTTSEDLNDLHAILDRYSDQETADIRRILAAQRLNPRDGS
jgi:Flp pilus assembly protein TadD